MDGRYDARESTGEIVKYQWFVDDAPVAEGAQTKIYNHRFTASGSHTVKVRVLDAAGASDEAERQTDVIRRETGILFFSYTRASDVSLCCMDPDTGEVNVPYTDPNLDARGASWEPGGKRIVLGTRPGGVHTDIALLDVRTRRLQTIVATPGIAWAPTWSNHPDPIRRRIAYVDDTYWRPEQGGPPGGDDLYVVRPAGGGRTALGGEGERDRDYMGWNPSWSPDGESLALGNAEFIDPATGEALRRRRRTRSTGSLIRPTGASSITLSGRARTAPTSRAGSSPPAW